jgi:hypothetical protein
MGYSNIELANNALDILGKTNIASLTENSTAARKMNSTFERTINAALARSHWTFARRIQELAGLTNDWSERWAYKYDLPSDMATAIRLIPTYDVPNGVPIRYELASGSLYCNEASAKLQYVRQTTATLTMPEPFLDAVAFLWARNVSMPFTKKRALWNDLNQAYETQLAEAVSQDSGQELTEYPQTAGGYADDRGSSTGHDSSSTGDGSIYWD